MNRTRHAILLVEDSLDDEILSRRAINNSGVPCTIKVARRGDEALSDLLSAEGPNPDLVVLDFHLPGLSGVEILRELRKHDKTRHVPVVILSALASDSEANDCFANGANSFVVKPDDPKAYVEQVALIVRYWFTVDRRGDT